MDKVAVLLPVYKNDSPIYFREALESLRRQTLRPSRIFIGVDGPVDGDLKAQLKFFSEEIDVVVLWFEENRGLACVLNDLINEAKNVGFDYYARMDADDISLPDRLEKQMSFLEKHPEVDVVGGAIDEIDEYGERRGKVIVYPEGPEECREFFSKRNPHAHPAVLFRKRFFEKAGCKYRSEYKRNQDTMLWYDGLMKGTVHANIPDVVLKFRITDSMFKKRRNGWTFAKKQFLDRLKINRDLGYGFMADIYGFFMFCLLISPAWIKKIAYKLFR